MFLKVFEMLVKNVFYVVTFIYKLLHLHLNVSVYVCEVVYICVSANARMHFFQMELSAANELSP